MTVFLVLLFIYVGVAGLVHRGFRRVGIFKRYKPSEAEDMRRATALLWIVSVPIMIIIWLLVQLYNFTAGTR